MLENRGKAPKVLWRWTVDSAEAPDAKTPIMFAGTAVGEVTSAVSGLDQASALGFLKRGYEAQGPDGRMRAGSSRAAAMRRFRLPSPVGPATVAPACGIVPPGSAERTIR